MTPDKMSDHDLLVEIHVCLKGSDGQGGLYREVAALKKSYYNFRLTVIVTGALLFGGSGFGFAKVLELIGR